MVITLVNQRDVGRSSLETGDALEAAEAGADDHDPMKRGESVVLSCVHATSIR
jgi:hypothetical protein